jgi:uncharacterized protein (TIGR04255 family)
MWVGFTGHWGLTVHGLPEHPHYPSAPILEAVLDFRVATLPAAAIDAIQQLGPDLGASYTRSERLKAGRISRSTFSDADGMAYASDDGKHVVQARLDGFSFSRLAPYDRWETFIAEARRTWDAYEGRVLRGRQILGFSVRYINEFTLEYYVPLHVYFNVYPAMPNRDVLFTKLFLMAETATDELPGRHLVLLAPRILMDDFDARYDEAPVSTTTAESLTPGEPTETPEAPPPLRIMLDNLFLFEAENASSAWSVMDRVRKIKNDVFNSQITERLKETLR